MIWNPNTNYELCGICMYVVCLGLLRSRGEHQCNDIFKLFYFSWINIHLLCGERLDLTYLPKECNEVMLRCEGVFILLFHVSSRLFSLSLFSQPTPSFTMASHSLCLSGLAILVISWRTDSISDTCSFPKMLFRLFFLCLLPTSFPIFSSVLSVWQVRKEQIRRTRETKPHSAALSQHPASPLSPVVFKTTVYSHQLTKFIEYKRNLRQADIWSDPHFCLPDRINADLNDLQGAVRARAAAPLCFNKMAFLCFFCVWLFVLVALSHLKDHLFLWVSAPHRQNFVQGHKSSSHEKARWRLRRPAQPLHPHLCI